MHNATVRTTCVAAKTGIPTYGISGMFSGPGPSGAHGLNEHLRVKSLYDSQEFLYRLGKRLATE